MKSTLLVLAALGLSLALGACSLFQPEKTPEERAVERLMVPPDLVLEDEEGAFNIPEDPAAASASSLAGGSDRPVLPQPSGIRLRQAGATRWLEVDALPGQVFGWVQGFLEDTGAGISRRLPELGILQSVWLMSGEPLAGGVFAPVVESPEDVRLADQYLIRLETGAAADTTEVYVSHRRARRSDRGWVLAGSDPFLTAEFQRALMLHLGVDRRRALREIASGAEPLPAGSIERGPDGGAQLRVEQDFLSAWRQVGAALDRAGFTVVDRDRSARHYFVRYDRRAEEGPKESSVLSALAFWRGDEPDSVTRYRIDLEPAEGATLVRVLTEGGEPAEATVAERLLGLLKQQLR